MFWFRSILFLSTGCFLAPALAHVRTNEKNCLSVKSLRETWKEIEKLNRGTLSQECAFMNKSSLCEPAQIVKMGVSDKAAIVLQILNETAKLFERQDVLFSNVRDILEYINYRRDQLKLCLQSQISLPLTDSPVEECFRKLQLFLNDGNSNCTWKVAHEDVMEVFQRLEFGISASRRRLRRDEMNHLLFP